MSHARAGRAGGVELSANGVQGYIDDAFSQLRELEGRDSSAGQAEIKITPTGSACRLMTND